MDNLLFIAIPRKLKKNRTVHTQAARICENMQSSHSSQLAPRCSVSKLWKEESKLGLR